MNRRHTLVAAAAAPTAWLAGCGSAQVQGFASVSDALNAIEALATGWRANGAWSLPQVLQHLAQSIEFSLTGFPAPKSALFQKTVGTAAFAVFEARGKMSHSLSEPIPGAPQLDAQAALGAAIDRLTAAVKRFESHPGPLSPHFAYGALDKAQYTRAHLMHLANHWNEFAKV